MVGFSKSLAQLASQTPWTKKKPASGSKIIKEKKILKRALKMKISKKSKASKKLKKKITFFASCSLELLIPDFIFYFIFYSNLMFSVLYYCYLFCSH